MAKAYLLLFGSMFFLGLGNLFFQKSSLSIGAFLTTVWYYIIGAVFAFLILSFSKEKRLFIPVGELRWVSLIALSLLLSVFMFSKAIQSIPISIASTIRSMSFIVTIIIVLFLGNEDLSLKKGVGFFLAIGAVYCMK